MPGNAFVYGTLMADEVVQLLIHRVPRSKPAALSGYQRYRVKEQVFPAIIPCAPTSKVQGMVLLDLSDRELKILDVYESQEYFRQTVTPVLEDGSEVEADVYIWKNEFRPQLQLGLPDWDYSEFRQAHMGDYLRMTADFMDQFAEELK